MLLLLGNELKSTVSKQAGAGKPPTALDLRFGFTSEDVAYTFKLFGAKGRQLYLVAELVDFVYMYGYSMVLATLLSAGLSVMKVQALKIANLVPVVAALADVVENSVILAMLVTYPGNITQLAPIASAANMLKWRLVHATICLVLGTGFFCVYTALKQGQRNKHDSTAQATGSHGQTSSSSKQRT
eukprot:jgi/Chrzof1/13800/Cz08g12260.t1